LILVVILIAFLLVLIFFLVRRYSAKKKGEYDLVKMKDSEESPEKTYSPKHAEKVPVKVEMIVADTVRLVSSTDLDETCSKRTRQSESHLSKYDEMSLMNENEFCEDYNFNISNLLKSMPKFMNEPDASEYETEGALRTKAAGTEPVPSSPIAVETPKAEDLGENLKKCVKETDV
jgi:hypothetical protein